VAKRPVIFGEVLFDRFPDGSAVLGGAPFNVAWNLQAFGQAPLLISRVGQDALGEQIRETMTDWSMDTSCLQSDMSHPTGIVDISFRDGEPSYDIVAGSAYDFIESAGFAALDNVAVLYHGSLALRSDATRQAFAALVAQLPVPRFVDVNLRAPWWHQQGVLDMIDGATWVKLNQHELALLSPDAGPGADVAEDLRQRHSLQGLILTRGSRGAELLGDETKISVAPESATQVVDTVGAGDAFASVILLGLLQAWPLQITLERAQSFASAAVGLRGATTTDANFYSQFSAAWGIRVGA